MADVAKLILGEKQYDFPVRIGTEGNRVIDIDGLFERTGHITLDYAFANTGGTTSKICFKEGETGDLGWLWYRGYPVEDIARNCDYLESAYLLIRGELPGAAQLAEFRGNIRRHTLLHDGMQTFFAAFPPHAHPMAILGSAVGALSIYCHDALDVSDPRQVELAGCHLLAKLPTIAAFGYKQSIGEPFIYPQNELSYCQNFLHMMFATPSEKYSMDPDFVEALNTMLVLYGDHGQNCSTTAVRTVGSSDVNLFACVSAGIWALWGDLHGASNVTFLNMLEHIREDGGNLEKYLELAKSPNAKFHLKGLGHGSYKNCDPRARFAQGIFHRLLERHPQRDPVFDLALKMEDAVTRDPFFVERHLFPNLEFYSGLIFRIIGIPKQMFTALFAIGRLPGWIAHWAEVHDTENRRLYRSRQLYLGPPKRAFIPLDKR
ncbi:MAG: citrate synthase [Pirellulales bacterium]|nr:citrate synthase [Pirellulales bacterium]